MKKFFIITFVFIATTLFLFGNHSMNAKQVNVLIIHTYHSEFRWVRELQQGITDTFQTEEDQNGDIAFHFYVEYLDSLRGYPGTDYEYHYEVFNKKYENIRIDIIIVCDDFSVLFMEKYHDQLFNNIPVVFCGLDNEDIKFPYTVDWITGVYQNQAIKENILLIKKLHPNIKSINIIAEDNSITSARIFEEFTKLREENFEINWNVIINKNIADYIELLKSLPSDSVILMLSANYFDEDGNFVRLRDSSKIISENSNLPIYAIWTFHIYDEVVGGIMSSAYNQGKNAADMAIRIIKGENPADIDPLPGAEKEILFNYDQLVKYNIPLDILPEGSIIRNKPKSVFEVFPELSITIVFSIIIMIIIIIILFIFFRIQKYHNEVLSNKNKLLEISESKFSSLFSGMQEGVVRCRVIIDQNSAEDEIADLCIENVNKSFKTIFNIEGKNLADKSFIEIGEKIDIEMDVNFYEFLKCSYLEEKTVVSPDIFSREIKKWFKIRAYKSEEGYVTSIINDITELKEKEFELGRKNEEIYAALEQMEALNETLRENQNELENLVELLDQSQERLNLALIGANETMWDWDIKKGTYYATDFFYTMLGYMKNELDDTFKALKEMIYPEDKPLVLEELKKYLTGEINFFSIKFRLKCKDNTWKWVHGKGRVSKRDSVGRPMRMTGVYIDISEEKAKEKLLAEADDLIKESAIIKENFLANVSHELRTPMNGIIGMTKLLSLTDLDKEQFEYVDMIATSSKNLMEIINGILDLSKIEAKKVEIIHEEINIRDTVENIIKFSMPIINTKEVEIYSVIDENIYEKLISDENNIKVILNNLISNAIKFTEKGYIKIIVEKISEDDEEVIVKFSVEDTGIGIPKEKQSKIFDPFTQADGSTTRKYGGTGLGLTISKKLIELMGGRMWVNSDTDTGSTFSFTIKMKKIK